MKEVDDTPVNESKSEIDLETICALLYPQVAAFMEIEMHRLTERLDEIGERIDRLLVRITNLETQRTPQDENDDPEWY